MLLREENGERGCTRVSLVLGKQKSMGSKASNTERPFLPVAILIQLNLGRQCL